TLRPSSCLMSFSLACTAPTETYTLSLHDALPILTSAMVGTHVTRVCPSAITSFFIAAAHSLACAPTSAGSSGLASPLPPLGQPGIHGARRALPGRARDRVAQRHTLRHQPS